MRALLVVNPDQGGIPNGQVSESLSSWTTSRRSDSPAGIMHRSRHFLLDIAYTAKTEIASLTTRVGRNRLEAGTASLPGTIRKLTPHFGHAKRSLWSHQSRLKRWRRSTRNLGRSR